MIKNLPLLKKALLIISILLFANSVFSQDYMDKIAKEACKCLDDIPENSDQEEYNSELGLCMLSAAMPYQKKLKKDYGIDFKNIDTQAEGLGKIIGIRMATTCPVALMKIVAMNQDEEAPEVEYVDEINIDVKTKGKISVISDDKYPVFSVIKEDGETEKYYWLTYIESDLDISKEYKTLIDKEVEISFEIMELYDSVTGEYKDRKVIKSIEVLSE